MKKRSTIFTIFITAILVFSSSIFVSAKAASGQDIVNYAKNFQGTPYVRGGTSPSGFDCSGFVQYVYRNCASKDLPRITYDQINVGTPVSRSELVPGDLVFPSADHVGIYVGNGNMIHASLSRGKVIVSSVYAFSAGRRILPRTFLKIDGGGTISHEGTSGMNLIIRDYSDDVARVFVWVDNDSKSSWAFEKVPENDKYTKLYKGTNRVINRRNGGSPFAPGATYKMTAKGYNEDRKVICQDTITLRVPNKISNSYARPIKSGSYTVTTSVGAREYPRDNASVTRNLREGEKVDIYAEYGDWYLVTRGEPQWVNKNYLVKY